MEKLSFEDIKNRIDNYVKNGGSIYDERRVLPYYNNFRKIKDKMLLTNPNATMVDVYKLFGYDFDREYGDYLEVINGLKPYADEDGYVDSIKELHGKKNMRTKLSMMALKYNCTPSDFLILMTPYRYKNAYIKTNYVALLQQELNEAYPDADLSRIKRENPGLYEKMRHLAKYSPEHSSMQDIAFLLGKENDRFSDKEILHYVDETKIKDQLLERLKTEDINTILKDRTFYNLIAKCAAKNDQTIPQWLKSVAKIDYKEAIGVSRLSKAKVDSNKREQQINAIKNKILSSLNLPKPQNEIEKYYQNKKIALLILKEFEKQMDLFM